ncbi:type 1 glutamine amidotransferase [Saccharicrinis sp. FJH2]|uniref:type 1 glutamine amidotransferase n=1 Tax=Saccharicrinis sp. FJH65 TaxID=3344659 RepID=UPI0035F32E34
MKKVLILKHVEFEGPGRFLKIFESLNYTITYCNIWKDSLPSIKDYDLFLIMGGPMSVNDTEDFPWLEAEKQFISSAINAGKKVIGICLGAQLIASTLGEPVFLGEEKEIGWYPVRLNNNDLHFVFHWHGETYDLPVGAELLASSAACENQIFTYNKNVIAFQCHLEMDESALKSIVDKCRDELTGERFMMTEEQIMDGLAVYGASSFELLKSLILPFLKEASFQPLSGPVI